MGRDTDRLRIISMNASGRKGRLYQDYRKSFLEDVIGNDEPDILFLPGDHPNMKSSVMAEYDQVNVLHNNDTILLYDTKRIQLHSPKWYEAIPSLVVPGIDKEKLMYPLVDVKAPLPTQNVVKQFYCISWHWELTQTTSQERYQFAFRYVWLAQYLAWIYGFEVLIGGDFNLPVDKIEEILNEHNNLVQKSIDEVKPFFQEMGYLDDMTDYVHRPQRRLRQLKLHKCKSVEGIQHDTDYFVSSKEMQLCNTEMMENSNLRSRCAAISMPKPVVQTYCPAPTKTEMCIPSRPPRHNGG